MGTGTNSNVSTGITAATIKNRACIIMLIDHFTGTIYKSYLVANGISYMDDLLYNVGRMVGRLAFVLFAYLIVQGMDYSHNRLKYIGRMSAFAILSEIPFDMANKGVFLEWENQNVFLTLVLGAATVYILQEADKRLNNKALANIVGVTALILMGYLGFIIRCDYRFFGVALIYVLYLCRKNYRATLIAGSLMLTVGFFLYRTTVRLSECELKSLQDAYDWFVCNREDLFGYLTTEASGIISLLIIGSYNGQKGHQLPKYFYYAFYPVHLLVFGIIRMIMF